MASEVGICNSALIKIGAARITSLTEGSKNANLCNEQYAKLRDSELRGHTWNFAKTRVKLAQISGAPVSGFDYHYQLPTDWLRAIAAYDSDADQGVLTYEIKGDRLLADSTDVYLVYVRQVTDPNDMDAMFREALAYRLAAELAIPIASSGSLHDRMMRGFGSALRRAKSADAIEDFPEQFPSSPWVTGR